MIDFKLSIKNTKDAALFNLLSQARKPEEIGTREPKGTEIETLPYFLTTEYASIMRL
jgi:hypothetical protein